MRRFSDDTVYPASTVSIGISDLVMSLLNCPIGPVVQATASKGVVLRAHQNPFPLTFPPAAAALGVQKGTVSDVSAAIAALTDCAPIPRSCVLLLPSCCCSSCCCCRWHPFCRCSPPALRFLLLAVGKLLQGGVEHPLHELHSACMCVA